MKPVPGLPGGPAPVNRLVIARGEARSLVYYWYQSRGHVIADDYRKIVHLFWDRATRNRTDGSLVRFTVPVVRGDDDIIVANIARHGLWIRLQRWLKFYLPCPKRLFYLVFANVQLFAEKRRLETMMAQAPQSTIKLIA